MDVMQACRCCLRCPPDKDLTTPYTHLGGTEIYADMLRQCFNIQLLLDDNGPRGICSACVGRLRDASDFKLQVQRSQAELQARLGVCLQTKEEPAVEAEMQDGDAASEEPGLSEEPPIKTELLDEERHPDDILHEMPGSEDGDGDRTSENDEPASPEVKEELSDAASDEGCLSHRARQQLAMTCSVRLERLRGDERHTSVHTGQKPYTCEHCGKQFRSKSTIIKHIQYTHLSTGPKLLISEHEKREHGVTNFMCSKCEYTTDHKKFLLTHLKTHTANNLFKCSQCSYTNRYQYMIRRHQQTHTRITKKPFQCRFCKYKTHRKAYLSHHEIIHSDETPFQCCFCKYKCREESKLKLHQSLHTPIKSIKSPSSVTIETVDVINHRSYVHIV